MIDHRIYDELVAKGLGDKILCIAGDGSFCEDGLELADVAAAREVIASHLARRTPLALAIEAKRQEINEERDRRRYGILTVDGVRYDADRESRSNITGRAAMCAAGAAAASFVWMDADNMPREHTPASFLALCVAMDEQTQAIYATSWIKKAELEQLPDAEAVAAYDVAAGWPV